jgi:PAS domain S-box-containing protein
MELTTIDFRKIFESAPGLYLVLLPDFSITAVSDAYLAATFTKRDQVVGKNIFDAFPDNPNDPAATGVKYLRISLNYVLQHRKPHTMAVQQYDIKNENGQFQKRFWSPLNTPVLDDRNKISYIIHKVEDVTDFIKAKEDREQQTMLTENLRRKVEQMEADIYQRAQEIQEFNLQLQDQVKEKTAELRSIFERISDGFVAIDKNGNFIYINSRAENELGVNARNMYGKNMWDVFPKDIREPLFTEMLNESLDTHQPRHIEVYSNLYKSWFEVHSYPSEAGVSIFFRDISERKKAEEELKSSEYKYKLLFESNPLPMWMLSLPERNFVAVNSAAVQLYGYSKDEFLTMNATDIRPPEEVARFLTFMNSPSPGIQHAGNWIHRKKNGSLITAEIITHDIYYEGSPARLVLANDISERLKAEEKLNASYQQLRKLASHLQDIREEEQKRIAREVHDELGQQITGLKMDIAWIWKKIAGKGVDVVEEKLKDMSLLLDAAVTTIRKIASELRPSILDDLGVIAALEWQTREFEKRFMIPVQFNTSVHHLDIDANIATGLFRLYQESLTNVARHAKASLVDARLVAENNHITLTVTDNGNGFDTQLVNGKKTLGLLGMKERAVMMNGNLIIDSTPGNGTRVEITVPLQYEKNNKAVH